jgi:hypothetical protein
MSWEQRLAVSHGGTQASSGCLSAQLKACASAAGHLGTFPIVVVASWQQCA